MANNILIQGAKRVGDSKAFMDIGEIVGKGLMTGEGTTGTPSTVKKNNQYQNTVNDYMSKLKTGMDFSSFSGSETAAMRNFLMAERSKYADAAKNISKIEDASSPEYAQYVDVMNGVNNSFTNLAEQLKSYKKSKLDYAGDQLNNSLSKGMDPDKNRESMIMYGFYDGDGDKRSDASYDAPLQITEGGNIGFNIDNKLVAFNDSQAPIYKDYELANSILKSNESIYKSGTALTKTDNDMYRMQLEEQLQNPNALKSIVYDFESELGMKDIGNIWDANKGAEGEINIIRSKVIDRLVKARNDVANEGIAEKSRKDQASINKAVARSKAIAGAKVVNPTENTGGWSFIEKDGVLYATRGTGKDMDVRLATKEEIAANKNTQQSSNPYPFFSGLNGASGQGPVNKDYASKSD